MKRPWYLRLTPPALRTSLYYRFCRAHVNQHPEWFDSAPLAFNPSLKMRLHRGDEMHGCMAATGLYETGLSRRIISHAKDGGLLVDVGANFGYFTLLWAAALPQNRVVAFEASPRNLPGLRHNVEQNGLEKNVRIEPLAAGRENGTLRFDLGPEEQTGWGGASVDGGVEVQVVRLDSALADIPLINVLKVDVEGADTWVLEGAEALLKAKRIHHIYYELNKPRLRILGIKEDRAEKFLQSLGYTVKALEDPMCEVVEYYAAPSR